MLFLAMVYVYSEEDSVVVPVGKQDARLLPNEITAEELHDTIEDSFFDPVVSDPSCSLDGISSKNNSDCWGPPETTVETEEVFIDATRLYGGDDPSELEGDEKEQTTKKVLRDKHWGSETHILKMRDKLRNAGKQHSNVTNPHENRRPPIFLMPGLASTRLVSWRYKSCSNPLLSDVKVQDYVWMNLNMLLQMATIDGSCFLECMTLGLNQTDYDDEERGCKLRPDEGLDAISSLAPDSIGSKTLVGGKNTVYAWLTQWLADNLGYDVSSIVGLPYDWRLSPDIMEKRDGFLTVTRRRIEAAVAHNGEPGIMVAHSMGNNVFRYFLEWLRNQMHEEAYSRLLRMTEVREKAMKQTQSKGSSSGRGPGWVAGLETEGKQSETATYSDTIYKMANSVVNSLDGIWQSVTGVSDEINLNDVQDIESPTLESKLRRDQLWELAQAEGDDEWLEWIDKHIWTYVGLSAPLLGAINPLRAVISGENMGMPMTEKAAREMEITFGSTHTLNPISTSSGFCDELDGKDHGSARSKLACLEELMVGIDETVGEEDPWENFPTLKAILKDRVDWDTDFVPFKVVREICEKDEKPPCKKSREYHFTPKDVQSGDLFSHFGKIWNEEGEPLKIKREQLAASWWMNPSMPNLLNMTWDRPHIKHVIMSYGVDYPTEVGYVFKKVEFEDDENEKRYEDTPLLTRVVYEEAENKHYEEIVVPEMKSLADSMLKKKPKKEFLNHGTMHRSGDASVPYLSLAWAHTWLLHATRAMRHSKYSDMKEGDRISDDNALDSIKVSYRPAGGSEWMDGGKSHCTKHNPESLSKDDAESDISVGDHPHGTKYKPEMFRYQSKGKSRLTGMEYTTAVIEAVGVEHKETTRNYDILAAVFSEVLINMHEDFGLV
jgi:hypothetical protein